MLYSALFCRINKPGRARARARLRVRCARELFACARGPCSFVCACARGPCCLVCVYASGPCSFVCARPVQLYERARSFVYGPLGMRSGARVSTAAAAAAGPKVTGGRLLGGGGEGCTLFMRPCPGRRSFSTALPPSPFIYTRRRVLAINPVISAPPSHRLENYNNHQYLC